MYYVQASIVLLKKLHNDIQSGFMLVILIGNTYVSR